MTRKTFLHTAGVLPLIQLADNAQPGTVRLERQIRSLSGGTISNAHFRLTLSAQSGLTVKLVHVKSGILLADGAYSYSFSAPSFQRISSGRDGEATIAAFEGMSPGEIRVKQEFRIPDELPWIEERITIENPTSHVLAMPHGRCGFVLPHTLRGDTLAGPLRDYQCTAAPYRREPSGDGNQYADYTLKQVLTEPRGSRLRKLTMYGSDGTLFPEYASEGWVVTNGLRGFLITKYSQEGMEWAVLDRLSLDGDRIGLRWGGFGIFEGDPEHGAWLPPGQSHRFGVTRITAFEGSTVEGFYAFRAEMEDRGHGCPKDFDPPVHWNELYDNKLWWSPDQGKPESRAKYYRLSDMREEAAKARDIGCEALYLDPGWDTLFASKIWHDSRLGKMTDFVAMLRADYGLSLSLHTPLSGWCDPDAYSRDIDRMHRDGSRAGPIPHGDTPLCGASLQYVRETAARLAVLARDGATFFMFDGTAYHGECWDPKHGHPVPARREAHVQATSELARLVHARYPNVLIEMHDQMVGGSMQRFAPTYYGHGLPPPGLNGTQAPGYDSVWAFELMWDPMADLVSGHAIALYYYNLAYSLPLYIHIDLRKDNGQALMLWWNASTCRHLGVGGTHEDATVRQAQRAAIAAYRRLKPFFAAGVFYGIDETVHVHRHPSQSAAVINCFNLEDRSIRKEIEFAPARFGLDPGRRYSFAGATSRQAGDHYVLEASIADQVPSVEKAKETVAKA